LTLISNGCSYEINPDVADCITFPFDSFSNQFTVKVWPIGQMECLVVNASFSFD